MVTLIGVYTAMRNSIIVNGHIARLHRVQENATINLFIKDLNIVPGLLLWASGPGKSVICQRKPLTGIVDPGHCPTRPNGPEGKQRIWRNDHCDVQAIRQAIGNYSEYIYTTVFRFTQETYVVRVQRNYVDTERWFIRTKMHHTAGWCEINLRDYDSRYVLGQLKRGYLHIQGPDYQNAYHCVL